MYRAFDLNSPLFEIKFVSFCIVEKPVFEIISWHCVGLVNGVSRARVP